MSVEVMAKNSDSHDQMIEHGRSTFNVDYSIRGMVLALFTMSGAMILAVKVLTQEGCQALARSTQMQCEVSALTRFRHPNIVQLCGFCSKPPSLLYEYMCGGSLYDLLHDFKDSHTPLSWQQRVTILKDTCRGIVYLHSAEPPMIHQDIKSAPKFTATCIARTEGYYPSEISSGRFSDRSDIYCYGVVVLETFCGQLVFDLTRPDKKLVDHLEEQLHNHDDFLSLHDPYLSADNSSMLFYKVQRECLRSHSKRPSAAEVMKIWEAEA